MDIVSSKQDASRTPQTQHKEFVNTLKAYQEYLVIENPLLAGQLMEAIHMINTSLDSDPPSSLKQIQNISASLYTETASNVAPSDVFATQNPGNQCLDQNGDYLVDFNGNCVANQKNIHAPLQASITMATKEVKNVSNTIYPDGYLSSMVTSKQQRNTGSVLSPTASGKRQGADTLSVQTNNVIHQRIPQPSPTYGGAIQQGSAPSFPLPTTSVPQNQQENAQSLPTATGKQQQGNISSVPLSSIGKQQEQTTTVPPPKSTTQQSCVTVAPSKTQERQQELTISARDAKTSSEAKRYDFNKIFPEEATPNKSLALPNTSLPSTQSSQQPVVKVMNSPPKTKSMQPSSTNDSMLVGNTLFQRQQIHNHLLVVDGFPAEKSDTQMLVEKVLSKLKFYLPLQLIGR